MAIEPWNIKGLNSSYKHRKTCHNICQDNLARLVVGWDSAIVDVEVLSTHQLIHSEVVFKASTKEVYCSLAPLWADLVRARVASTGLWTVVGDFNIMRFGNEKVGGLPPNSKAMREFNDGVARNGLGDINCKEELSNFTPKHSKFFNFWIQDPLFHDVVKKAWEESQVRGPNPWMVVASKCNKTNFGDLCEVVEVLESSLHACQKITVDDPFNPRMAELEKEFKEKHSEAMGKEEALLK
ncbi:hypothetical protein NE237_031667 [Protea cynaroides]|uniref:Uncharacterized protein n=1 Tax=Protea cynaroides TaxID=273540 RepID=A0A9Q0R2C4_9MAGN|nr:hypothetical protein NE237_031667 [Protea cynaroides]